MFSLAEVIPFLYAGAGNVSLHSSGKIYVVAVTAAIVLFGIFFYLIRLERKINRLEEQEKEEK